MYDFLKAIVTLTHSLLSTVKLSRTVDTRKCTFSQNRKRIKTKEAVQEYYTRIWDV